MYHRKFAFIPTLTDTGHVWLSFYYRKLEGYRDGIAYYHCVKVI